MEHYFEDDYQSGYLSQETAWWDLDGDELVIYVWKPTYNTDELQLGAIVHEAFEGLILTKFKLHNNFLCNCVHWFSNILEIIVSLGKSPVTRELRWWRVQLWSRINK